MAVNMIVIIGKPNCKFCVKAEDHCEEKGIPYEYFDMTDHPTVRDLIMSMGAESVPQIFDGFKHIGGYTELVQYNP